MTTATRQPAPSAAPRSVPASARPLARPRAEAIWRVSDRVALVLLAAVCGLLVALTWGTWGDLSQDTGYELVAATRVAHGEVPYSDFIYYYGPLGPALLGAFYAVFGTSIGVAMAFGLGVATAIVGLTYAVARMLVPPVGALVAAGLAAVPAFGADNNSFVMPHSLSAPLAILLTLALVGALGRRSGGGARAWLLVAGAALGGLALTRPEFLLAGAVAAAAWVALQLVIGRRAGLARAAGDALRIAGPALLDPGRHLRRPAHAGVVPRSAEPQPLPDRAAARGRRARAEDLRPAHGLLVRRAPGPPRPLRRRRGRARRPGRRARAAAPAPRRRARRRRGRRALPRRRRRPPGARSGTACSSSTGGSPPAP